MSGTRADRLERLQKLQKRKREMEEWRLAELERKAASLAAETEEILKSLGDQSLLNGLFLEAKANALRRKEGERAVVRAEAERAKVRLTEAGGVEKRLERIAGEARSEQTRTDESAALAEILDGFLISRSASLE